MTDTPQEQVATTIADDLANAFAAYEEKETTPEPEVSEEPAKEAAEASEPETKDEVAEKVEQEFPLIPKDWSEEEKAHFQGLIDSDDEDVAAAAGVLIERYNLLKKGFYKTTRESAEAKKLVDVLAPVKEALQRNNIPEAQYVQNLMTWDKAITENPAKGIKQLIAQYGVKAEDLGFDSWNEDFTNDSQYDNVEISSLKQELQNLKAQLANAPVETQIKQFEQATDAEGKLAHPHFKEVRSIMGGILQSNPTFTLKQAYDKAVKTLDLEEIQEPEDAINLDKIREKVAKARKAGRSVKPATGKVDLSQMSLVEELAARFNGLK